MFINNALAQAAETAAEAAPASEVSFMNFAPIALIFAVFYFLIVRPQTKKMKEHQATINNLKIGNKVITNSGIIGVVTDINEKENQVELEIAPDVKIKIIKTYVADLAKSLEAKTEKKSAKK